MGGATAPRERQTFGGESLLVRYANFVKLPHTVFALPFALLGVLVASRQTALTWRTLGLVVLAFACARFVALGFNRIVDRQLDARNPRTRGRELPSGRLTLRQAWSPCGAGRRGARGVRRGAGGAILAAKRSHGLALGGLGLVGGGGGLGIAYSVGVAGGGGLSGGGHRLVRGGGDLSRLNAAFFTANGIV